MHEGHRARLKQSFLTGGLEPFSPHNVLELILFYALPRKDTNPIAHALLDRFGSLSAVFDAPVEELMKVDGIGENCAVLLKLFPAVSRTYLMDKQSIPELDDTETVKNYCVNLFVGEVTEKAYLLCFDSRNRLLNCILLNEGSLSTVNLDKRRLIEAVIRNNTTGVVLTHNHPNGVAAPSKADVESTRSISYLLSEISVKFLDHIIVADNDCFSMMSHVNFVDLFI